MASMPRTPANVRRRCAPTRADGFDDATEAMVLSSVTAETRRPQPQHQGREQYDRHAAEDGAEIAAYHDLRATKNQSSERKAKKGRTGHHHQHEGVDQP